MASQSSKIRVPGSERSPNPKSKAEGAGGEDPGSTSCPPSIYLHTHVKGTQFESLLLRLITVFKYIS